MRRREFLAAGVIVTGDGLVRGIGAPPGGNLPIGVQPGVNSAIVIANKVIVFGTGGGVFIYNGTPGLGNPPVEYMTGGLVDPYGNTLPSQGIVSNSGTAVILNGGAITFTGGGTSSLIGANSPSGSGAAVQVLTGDFYALHKMFTAGGIYATVAGSAETWHSMTLLNSWANNGAFTASRYRLMPDNSVRVQGVINATAATAATFFTLPAGYIPATTGGAPVGCNAGAGANTVPTLRWDTSGNLTINNLTIPSASAVFFTQDIPLD